MGVALLRPGGDPFRGICAAQALELLLALAPERVLDTAPARIDSPFDRRIGERGAGGDFARERKRGVAKPVRLDQPREHTEPTARVAATRRSQAKARSAPKPTAAPSIIAIVGLLQRTRLFTSA